MKVVLRIVLLTMCFALTTYCFSQTDIFVRINGLPGDSRQVGFTDYYEAYEIGQATIACASGSCATIPGNVTVNLFPGAAIPLLQLRLLQQMPISIVDIVFSQPNPFNNSTYVYYQIRLDNVFVKSIAEVGSRVELRDQLTFSFDKISWKYTQLKSDGTKASTTACWDVKANKTTSCPQFPFQ